MAADPTTATRRLALAAVLVAIAFGFVVAAILSGPSEAPDPASPGLVLDPVDNPLLARGAEPGTSVPDDEYETVAGDTASLADYAGQPLVVNFFASWCAPCVAEMPAFEAVHQRLGSEVAFVGLAVRDRREDAEDIVARTGVTYDIGRDPAATLHQRVGAVLMPSTVFVAPDGRIVAVHNGQITAETLERLIEEHLR